MALQLPPLVELPAQVPEAEIWTELAAAVGAEVDRLGPNERRWLTVAALHRSALYEDRVLSPIVAKECLSLLEGVGTAVLDLELKIVIGQDHHDRNAAERNREQARLVGPTRRALVEELGLVTNARLGTGERLQLTQRASGRTLEAVMLQLLGWWSLMLPSRPIHDLVRRIHNSRSTTTSAAAAFDWRTPFQQRFKKMSPTYTSTQRGLDHAAVFDVTVTTRDGRSGTGSAPRKKDAVHAACHAYLAAYAPDLLPRKPAVIQRFTPETLPIRDVDKRLSRFFGVSDATLFSRALTHMSWTYENTVSRDRRESNEVLAFLGSAVLGLIVARSRAAHQLSTTTEPDRDLSTGLTVPDADLVPLGESLRLRAGVRLGAGQQQFGVSIEMLADLVQAVLAATYVQVGDVRAFEAALPPVVAGFFAEQGVRSTRDAATRLQELAAELDLEWAMTTRRYGPDHMPTFEVAIRIVGGRAEVAVDGAASSKTEAKKAAAGVAIHAAGLCRGAAGAPDRPDVARFFLKRQLEMLAAKPNRWPQWQQANIMASGRMAVGDWAAFGSWVAAVHSLGFPGDEIADSDRRVLESFYQYVARAGRVRPLFASALTRVLRWIDQAKDDDRLVLQQTPWLDLVALTAAHSVWMVPDGTADLADLLQHWARRDRRRDTVVIDVRGPATTGAQVGAAVMRVLQEYQTSGTGTASGFVVTLLPGAGAHKIELRPAPVPQSSWSTLIDLICEATSGFTVEHGGGVTVLQTADREPIGVGWLWDAAVRGRAPDEYDFELARLLHDLKNEVTGARLALTQPTSTRTEQRDAALRASRHVDSAAALAARLDGARLLYDDALAGSCDLGSFLRGYSSDLINRLPAGIRVVPAATVSVHVSIGADVLRGILDNLVKNAVEALVNNGEIEFDYTVVEADRAVLLEVRDTGPGVPDEVVAALRTTGPAPSGKRHGSGLGLAGALRMVRRVGGDLQPLRTEGGATWLMRLPMVDDPGPDADDG